MKAVFRTDLRVAYDADTGQVTYEAAGFEASEVWPRGMPDDMALDLAKKLATRLSVGARFSFVVEGAR